MVCVDDVKTGERKCVSMEGAVDGGRMIHHTPDHHTPSTVCRHQETTKHLQYMHTWRIHVHVKSRHRISQIIDNLIQTHRIVH